MWSTLRRWRGRQGAQTVGSTVDHSRRTLCEVGSHKSPISRLIFPLAVSLSLCLMSMLFLQCGVADGEGFLSIWQVNQTASNPKPYMVSAPHVPRAHAENIVLQMKCLLLTGISVVLLWEKDGSAQHELSILPQLRQKLPNNSKQLLLFTLKGNHGFSLCTAQVRIPF